MNSIDHILDSRQTCRPIVMGIVNVTPDSFSDGGEFYTPQAALQQAQTLLAEGADILDIGAESTRPGSERVTAAQQIERLKPILPAVCESGATVSIDTTLAAVAEFALDCGAAMINDVSAGRDDPAMLSLAGERQCPICLMHMLGEPKTMQAAPQYKDVVAEVKAFLAGRIEAAEAAGVLRSNCIPDPGVGFGKTLEHNLALLGGTEQLLELQAGPVLVGASRKRFIGELTGQADPAQRLGGTIAACLETYRRGATIFRVHDVAPVVQALRVAEAILRV